MDKNISKWTPTPWKVAGEFHITTENERGICSTGSHNSNKVDPEVQYQENQANAAFIVKAANTHYSLLAELQFLHELVCISKGICGDTCGVRALIEEAS